MHTQLWDLQNSRMLSRLLLLLLEVPITWGQALEGTFLASEEIIYRQNDSVPSSINNITHNADTYNSTVWPHIDFHFSANGTFLKEEADHNVTFEDQESFQDQKNIASYRHCNETLLMMNVEFCWNAFHTNMVALGEENWCDWDKVIRFYNFLTLCLEIASAKSSCYFPGPLVQRLFVDIHKQYFSFCSTDNKDLPNAPLSVVLIPALLLISIIPIAVYIVIWKNTVKD